MAKHVLTAHGKGLNPLNQEADTPSISVYSDDELKRRLKEAEKRAITVDVTKDTWN